MAYSKTRTRFHPNLLNSPPHSDRLIVHYTLPPGVTLWMLNVKSRALNSSVIVRRVGICWLVNSCFSLSSPVFIRWRAVEQAFSLSAADCMQLCRSSWGNGPCSWAPWQFFFSRWLFPRHVNSLSLNQCFHPLKWGSLRNATLPFFCPLPHIFLLSLILVAVWSSPLLSTPW